VNAAAQRLPWGTALHVLHPGDVACGVQGDRFETLLGSCVAVVLSDPRRTVGAMCHIVHAGRSHGGPGPGSPRDSSWGDVALDTMYALLRQHGIEPRLCEAFVYGGGNMFPGLFTGPHVGASNARWTLEALAAHGVRLLHQDLGGARYRRLAWTVGPDAPHVTAVDI
jgi:chemotaxis protein CheD